MIREVLAISSLVALFAPVCALAQSCAVDISSPPQRVFAKPDASVPWTEFASLKSVPNLATYAGSSAQIWRSKEGNVMVRFFDPGEDFWSYTDLCYGSTGRLAHLSYQLRTAWGWGYTLDRDYGPNGPSRSHVSFVDDQGKPIPRPQSADDVPDALKPAVKLRIAQLPFYQLLKEHTK
jgi:hypothetical protein